MANNKYSLSEVLRMAEEIERNGGDFYRQAAKVCQDAAACEVMLTLAEQEDRHERLFASWRQQWCGAQEAHWWDPDGEAEAYVREVADSNVFTMRPDVAQMVASIQSAESALRLALNFEKDTIVFFTALKKAVKEEHRDKVEALIQEEREHVRRLNEALAARQ